MPTRRASIHREPGQQGAELGYLRLELIEGECLSQRLRRGTLGSADVLRLARELLLGIAAIHRAGVIHRDIKSRNVMLRGGLPSSIAIIDFGLAVESRAPLPYELAPCDRSSPFSFEGSPAYMAPEQFHDDLVTPATDLFACGVVLFEALTGVIPFRSFRAQKSGPGGIRRRYRCGRPRSRRTWRPGSTRSSRVAWSSIPRAATPWPPKRWPSSSGAVDAERGALPRSPESIDSLSPS